MRARLTLALVPLVALTACGSSTKSDTPQPAAVTTTPAASGTGPAAAATVPKRFRNPLPGMPPVLDGDVYAADAPGKVQPSVAGAKAYLYVPNSFGSGITTVIDQKTRKVVRILQTGELSQHVTPSYDLKTLYVEASAANRIVALDPATGKIEGSYPVERPYNLYFTPDGKYSVVMDEENQIIAFGDPHTFQRSKQLSDPSCQGPNHADFSANGRFFILSCEFSGSLLKIDTEKQKVVGRLQLPPGSKPQDVRLSPDGRSFFVADMGRDKLLRLPWNRFQVAQSWDLPMMPHGIYPSRNGKLLYISDRMAGEVSVFSLARRKVVDTWPIPGGGSPDMGGLSADGKTLWLSGRYSGYVYGWNTRTGKLIAKIWVGQSPHGLLVWPQPGRYSLGHTGNMR